MNLPSSCHRKLARAALLLVMQPVLASAEMRTFKDSTGRTIEAEIVSASASAVTIRRSDGRTFVHPPDIFSVEDQAFIQQPAKKASAPVSSPVEKTRAAPVPVEVSEIPSGRQPYSFEVRVRSGKSDRISKLEQYDNRSLRLSFAVDITNKQPTRDFRGGKGTLIIMGRSVIDVGEYGVLGKEEFSVDMPATVPFHFDAKSITSEYDDKGGSSRFGYRYSGYLFVLQDSDGNIIHAEASPEANSKFAQKALGLKVLDYVDRSFETLKGRPTTTIRLK